MSDPLLDDVPRVRVAAVPDRAMRVAVSTAGVGLPGERGPAGLPGQGASITRPALEPVTIGQVLVVDAGGLRPGSSTRPDEVDHLAGIARNSAASGADVTALAGGPLPVGSWPAGTPLFLGPDGYPTPDPNTGRVQVGVGHSLGAGLLQVRLSIPLHHA